MTQLFSPRSASLLRRAALAFCLGTTVLVPLGPRPAVAQTMVPAGAESVKKGEAITVGRPYRSANGQYQFVFQADGNLVVQRADGSFYWGLNLMPGVEFWRAKSADVSPEGKLRLMDETGAEIWSSGTHQINDTDQVELYVTDGGFLALEPNGMFGAGVHYVGFPLKTFPVVAGEAIQTGAHYWPYRSDYLVSLQDDRNMVIAKMPENSFVWGLNLLDTFDFRQGASVEMRADGTLAVADAGGTVLWSVPQSGAVRGSRLELSPNGVLFIQRPDNSIAWSNDGSTPAPIIRDAPATAATPAPAGQQAGAGTALGGNPAPLGGGAAPLGGSTAQSGGSAAPLGGGAAPLGGSTAQLGGGAAPLGGSTAQPAVQLARTDPLPAANSYTFQQTGSQVLPGTMRDVHDAGGCARGAVTATEQDRIGRLALAAMFHHNDCHVSGAYNGLDFQVEQGMLTGADGSSHEAYTIHPASKPPREFLGSKHVVYYDFPEARDHTIYAYEGGALKKAAEVKAAAITPGQLTKVEGLTVSELSHPVTYVAVPGDTRMASTHKLGEGVEGAMLADTPMGRWESYRYSVPATPFDTATGFNEGPAAWANIYGQTRRFFPLVAAGQPQVVWQDAGDNDRIYLTALGTDLREAKTVELPNAAREKLAAATSDGQGAIFYLTIQRGGDKEDRARGIHLLKADPSGQVLTQATLNGAKTGADAMDVGDFGEFVADMAVSNGQLALMLARRLHRGADGLQHQSGGAWVFDAGTLQQVKSHGQTSGHSFGNFVMPAKDAGFLGLELGDSYPRGVQVHAIDATGVKSRVVYSFKTKHGDTPQSPDGKRWPPYPEASLGGKPAYKWSNDNSTYTELGGLVQIDSGLTAVFAGETDPSGRAMQNARVGGFHNDPRNIGLVKVRRDLDADPSAILSSGVDETGGYFAFNGTWNEVRNKGIVWLTKYTDKDAQNASRVKAAPLPDGNILVVWEVWTADSYVSTWAMKVSDTGATLAAPYELGPQVRLARQDDPLVVDGRVLLVAGDAAGKELVVTVLTP